MPASVIQAQYKYRAHCSVVRIAGLTSPATWHLQLTLCACRYIMQTYARPEIVFTHAEGVRMYDAFGKEYLDFAAGIAVNALGQRAQYCWFLPGPQRISQYRVLLLEHIFIKAH